jgi:hypothetical protein
MTRHATPDRLAQVDIFVVSCTLRRGRWGHVDVRLHWHVVDHLLGFIQQPRSSMQR